MAVTAFIWACLSTAVHADDGLTMSQCNNGSGTIYDYSMQTLGGKTFSLKSYAAGDIMLVVNVASF